jgi:hypothetical protein
LPHQNPADVCARVYSQTASSHSPHQLPQVQARSFMRAGMVECCQHTSVL